MDVLGSDEISLDALRTATDELVKAKRTANKKGEAAALFQVAEARFGKDGPKVALEAATEAKVLVEEYGDDKLNLKMLHLFTRLYVATAEGAEALQTAQAMLALAKKIGHKQDIALARHTVATAQYANNAPEEALDEAKQALVLYRDIVSLEDEAATLLTIAKAHIIGGSPDEAERSAKWSLKLFKDCRHRKGVTAALDFLVETYISNGQLVEARRVAEEELAACQNSGETQGEAGALHAPVLAYLANNDFNEALHAAKLGLSRLRALGDKKGEACMLLSMANVLIGQGQYDQAKRAADQARMAFQKLGDWEGEKSALQVLTKVHAAMGLQAPDSPFRTEALGILQNLANATEERSSESFNDAMSQMYAAVNFLTQRDFLTAFGPMVEKDRQGTIEFLQANGPEDIVELIKAQPVLIENLFDQPIDKTMKDRAAEVSKLHMYLGIRMGNLVYGPRFRQVECFVRGMNDGNRTAFSIIRPSSLADDWETEGWDWNPAVIDAAAHSGMGMGFV